jgi:hypothetical protein
MRTAIEMTGLNENRIRRWAAAGKVRIYRVEGVGTPRYDLEQLQALARGEPSPPPGGGLRDMEAAGQLRLALALDVLDDAIEAAEGNTAAQLAIGRAAVAVIRARLGLDDPDRRRLTLCYKRRGWYELPRAA